MTQVGIVAYGHLVTYLFDFSLFHSIFFLCVCQLRKIFFSSVTNVYFWKRYFAFFILKFLFWKKWLFLHFLMVVMEARITKDYILSVDRFKFDFSFWIEKNSFAINLEMKRFLFISLITSICIHCFIICIR